MNTHPTDTAETGAGFIPCGGWHPGANPSEDDLPADTDHEADDRQDDDPGGGDEPGDGEGWWGRPAHWHVYRAEHHASPEHALPVTLWGPQCAHASPEDHFTDPGDAALFTFMEIIGPTIRNHDSVRMTATYPGQDFHEVSYPRFVHFDGFDDTYRKLFVQSLSAHIIVSHVVQFDVIYDPILGRRNVSIRVTSVPGDEAQCDRFACTPTDRYTPPRNTAEQEYDRWRARGQWNRSRATPTAS